MSEKYIYLYVDDGTCQISVVNTIKWIRDMGYNNIYTIDSQMIVKSNWVDNANLIIIPGGADIPYTYKLRGRGYKKIKNFIKNGGNYLGICAGGYFAANDIKFITSTFEVVDGDRLNLYSGTAYGPITGKYNDKNQSTAKALLINNQFRSYYNGGCFFDKKEALSNGFDILAEAQYNDKDYIVIIRGKYEKGNVLLTGIHPEYKSNYLEYIDIKSDIKDAISNQENEAQEFYKDLIKSLFE